MQCCNSLIVCFVGSRAIGQVVGSEYAPHNYAQPMTAVAGYRTSGGI